jgi:hypothetical protein
MPTALLGHVLGSMPTQSRGHGSLQYPQTGKRRPSSSIRPGFVHTALVRRVSPAIARRASRQIRTCAINASGSSSCGLAAGRQPVSLSVVVVLTCDRATKHPPSFPRTVPPLGAPTWGREASGPTLSLKPVNSEMETTGRPKFLENPDVPTPCSPTPARPNCQAIRQVGTAPRASYGESSPREVISGLNHSASAHAVYASQCGSHHPTQDSLLAAGPALPDRIAYPSDSTERFP